MQNEEQCTQYDPTWTAAETHVIFIAIYLPLEAQ